MAKKTQPQTEKSSATSSSRKTRKKPAKQAPTPASVRKLEESLVQLLQAHAAACLDLAQLHPDKTDKLLTQLVQEKRINQLMKGSDGPLLPTAIAAVLRELAAGEKAQLDIDRVAFLGPAHSYSHLATLRRFGHSAELVPVGTIASVFQEVACGQVKWGVVPIENSTDGRIVDTLEMFTKTPVKICGEVPLPIHHNLLGSGKREGIQEIHSKPQAISQCREWLAHHMPHAKLIPTSSTTVAAQCAAQDTAVAAIASREAGVEYGLHVLAKHIEDNKRNVTRFAIIGTELASRTGNDKTSLMFELQHEPGALADAMVIFKRKGLNLTWIESFPKPNSPNEYLFFVELVGHPSDIKLRRAVDSLEKKTVRLEILGAYPIPE